MSNPLTVPPDQKARSFLDYPVATDLDGLVADVAILGIPYGKPYSMAEMANDQSRAPAAVRAASRRIVTARDRWDFDLGGTLTGGRDVAIVDCGDVSADMRDLDAHYRRAEAAVGKILAANALPIVIGGDHGVPIPVFRAFAGRGPITLVHVDAHLDWRGEVNGEREGYSSPIRRASEMDHIGEIYQIGLRGTGSARAEEVTAARDFGARIITAPEVHEAGMESVLARIPDGGDYYLTIDADGVDPTVMPAVLAPVPGGLTFPQMQTLIHGLVAKGRVVGMDVVEIAPSHDVNHITAIVAGRLIVNLIGAAARRGAFDRT